MTTPEKSLDDSLNRTWKGVTSPDQPARTGTVVALHVKMVGTSDAVASGSRAPLVDAGTPVRQRRPTQRLDSMHDVRDSGRCRSPREPASDADNVYLDLAQLLASHGSDAGTNRAALDCQLLDDALQRALAESGVSHESSLWAPTRGGVPHPRERGPSVNAVQRALVDRHAVEAAPQHAVVAPRAVDDSPRRSLAFAATIPVPLQFNEHGIEESGVREIRRLRLRLDISDLAPDAVPYERPLRDESPAQRTTAAASPLHQQQRGSIVFCAVAMICFLSALALTYVAP